jgi:hypothetical protein
MKQSRVISVFGLFMPAQGAFFMLDFGQALLYNDIMKTSSNARQEDTPHDPL